MARTFKQFFTESSNNSVPVDTVIASMKKADVNAHRGPRQEDHYDYWRQYPMWSLISISPERIHAVATNEELPSQIKDNNHEPVLVVALSPGKIIAQDGNHRVLAARARGDKEIKAWIPSNQIINTKQLDESPVFDDTNKEMSKVSSEDSSRDAANYRMAVQLMTLIDSRQVGDYTIEAYRNEKKCEVFALNGNKEVVGMLDCHLEPWRFEPGIIPKVQSVYVYDKHQRKGLAFAMYTIVLDIFGAIMSGYSLTGETGPGSFDIWQKLASVYPYKYIISNIASAKDMKIKAVNKFTSADMRNSREYFIVSKEKLV